jgi:Domain of unknown function (DUF4263)
MAEMNEHDFLDFTSESMKKTEYEYFEARIKNRTYISKRFDDVYTGKSKRFSQRITDSEQQEQFVQVKAEATLSITYGDRHQLKAIFIEDSRNIESLIIQCFTAESGKPHKDAYSFRGYEIENLYKFLKTIKEIPLENELGTKVDDAHLDKILLSNEQAGKIVSENIDIVIEALKTNITSSDIIALGYRKAQLEKFERLLEEVDFFEAEKERLKIIGNIKTIGDEQVWQKFFEENNWILGYGLDYIFNTPLEGRKLEQVVSGYSTFESGKRTDALMKTRGLINALCFGEIKTHVTDLLKQVKTSYRPEAWSISEELAGGVAQVHRTIQKSVKNILTKTEVKDEEGNISDEQLFLYTPKSFLIIGSLAEFISDNGKINETKYSSFEMYRQSLQNPEIITFDELLERAKYIVKNFE